MKRLAQFKKILITLGGLRVKFPLRLLDKRLLVDYNLRSSEADRDYGVILKLARGKKCILDVGANHGLISMLVALENPTAHVWAFEASEAAVNIINHNLRLNQLSDRVHSINTLVADRSGATLPFYWEGSSGGASITKGRLGHTIEIEKSTISIDDFVADKKIVPDFIKMDIEGAESIAIRGMVNTLKNHRPEIFMELHSFGRLTLVENAREIAAVLGPLNYHVVYLRTGKPIHDMNEMADRGRCHLLLTPVERFSPGDMSKLDLRGL
jgi:FkbM family methyltransferase